MSEFVVDVRRATVAIGNNHVLEDVDFQLQNGEAAYLIGKTGSGKTTLLRSLYGDLPIISGHAKVNDFDLRTIDRSQLPALRRSIGMIFQSFQLFQEWSVAKNLSYVLTVTGWNDNKKIQSRILSVLQDVGLDKKAKSKVFELSGGEQQRLAVGRAILNSPKLIIADEPTGNLDPDTADHIIRLLRLITQKNGTALVIASHDFRLIDKFPARVFECANHKLQEK